uniref:Cytochrome P450 monooxygenase n=1 Tax=Trametes versicolor TaxID=5325 RepID=A0AA86JC35_TRAVE|nr:cytochrome P450 monooxygenase [Trametes versicolor]
MVFRLQLASLSDEDRTLLLIVALGLVAHQVFKRHETFSISFHLSVSLLPPAFGATLLVPTVAPLNAILTSFTLYICALVSSTLAYRASPYHPLARYPGPFVYRLTKFYIARVGFGGHQYLHVKSLHDRYGDIVRIGPNELSLRDPSLLNPIYGTSGLPHGPLFVGRLLTSTNLPLVGIMDTEEHLERRKPWARAFTPAALKEYQPMVAARARQLVEALGKQAGEVDIAKWVNYFSYDAMSDMAFGGGSELLRDGDVNNVWHILDHSFPAATFTSQVPWLGPYLGRVPSIAAAQAQLMAYCHKLTLSRIERGSDHKDIFHYLSEEDRPSNPQPPLSRLIDDGVLAIVAGADTTSSALTSILYCLLTHPDACQKLQAEIDQFYPPGEDPSDVKRHLDMHYLTAVINEGMRVWPPVPSGVQRLVPHNSGGVTFGSTFLPAGTAVSLHTYSIFHDPRNFSPRPSDFWPERWLLAAGRISRADAGLAADAPFAHNDAAFTPFSHGPMNCVGKNLAMQEMRVVLCGVLQKYELRPREGWDPRSYKDGYRDFFVTTRPPVPVLLRTRR